MTELPGSGASPAKPLIPGMLLYPKFTLLDLAGPQASLGSHGETLLLWKTLEPVSTDTGITLNPTTTFADYPDELDGLSRPGGMETEEATQDEDVVDFIARPGPKARYITSVCTGSLLVAMAGLLDGCRATTHWAYHEALEALGVEAVRERVVAERNRFTGAGVAAGIDFGLTLLAELRGEEVAKLTEPGLEYDPKSPFKTGSPEAAGPELTAAVRPWLRA